eukprot:1941594-Pyramimonas_sp.AAC.1
MFPIESGAAHGCPASGSARAIAMGPLVRRLASFVETVDGTPDYDKGNLGVCADDTGLLAFPFDTLRALLSPLRC